MPQELLKDLKTTLGNKEILTKFQYLVEIEFIAWFSFQKKICVIVVENYAEGLSKIFCSYPISFDFFTLFQIFCPEL